MFKPTVEQYEAVWKLEKLPARQVIAPCGFGKTLTSVELDFRIPSYSGPRLVITTPGALSQWRDTFKEQGGQGEYVRAGRVRVYRRETRKEFYEALAAPGNNIFILPWHMLNKPEKKKEYKRKLWARDVLFPALVRIEWAHVICDEVHKLNGRKTATTLAVKALKTKFKSGTSATPATNVPWQWWSTLNWLYPKGVPQEFYEYWLNHTPDPPAVNAKELADLSASMFTSYWRFFDRYVIYEEARKGHVVIKQPISVRRGEEFSYLIAPFTYRGKKAEYAGKSYRTIEVDLTPQQRRAYDTMKRGFVAWLGEKEDEFLPAPNVISQLQRLQQFALGYATVKEDKVILAEPSAKLDALMEFLEDNPDERVLVYSSFRGPLDLLQTRLEKAGISYGVCAGTSTPAGSQSRERDIRDFAAGRLRVMCATLGAGGESIDGWQHACNTAVYLDRPWSPAVSEQSEGRLDRRGQRYTVNVIDIIAKGTVDISKGAKIEMKKSWLKMFVERS